MSRPYFSIVMPTKNRARLLAHAMESALGQDFQSFEIIVSDNCSSDDTESVAKGFNSPRVRYIRPQEPLTMPDHWEFALDYAQGEYITYLCDDDALCPGALQSAAAAIADRKAELLVLGTAIYYGDNWMDASLSNSAVVPPYSGLVEERASSDTLAELFKCWDTYDAPRMQNSFCRRSVIAQIREECGRLFHLIPDYSFAAFSLAYVPRWTYLNEPLRLQGVFAEGIGSTTFYNRGEKMQEFIREFKREILFERTPLKSPITTNFIAEALLMVKERAGDRLAGVDISWDEYFIACWDRLRTHEITGVNIEPDRAAFFDALALQPALVQSRVRGVISQSPSGGGIRKTLRRAIDSSSILKLAESLVRGGRRKSRIIYGSDAGFSNIWECAKRVRDIAQR
ncbi:MAG: glycosyltransferase [Deltaproteobacteria bacterium]